MQIKARFILLPVVGRNVTLVHRTASLQGRRVQLWADDHKTGIAAQNQEDSLRDSGSVVLRPCCPGNLIHHPSTPTLV